MKYLFLLIVFSNSCLVASNRLCLSSRRERYPEYVRVNLSYEEVFSPLMCAVLEGDAIKVKQRILAGDNAKERFSYNRTMLHVAHNPDIAKILITQGLRSTAVDINGRRPSDMKFEERLEMAKSMIITRYLPINK
jgi:hypothetical protein